MASYFPIDGAAIAELPEDVINVVLHFMYTHSLPKDISCEQIQRCYPYIQSIPELEALVNLAKAGEEKIILCQRIRSIVADVYQSGQAILTELTGRQDLAEMLLQNPSRVIHIVRQCFRFMTIGIVQTLHLGHVFNQNKHKLIRAEQNEIIDFAKSCLPVFLKQIQAFLNSFKVMANSSSMRSRLELASHVIPELEAFTQLLITIGCALLTILEEMAQKAEGALEQSTGRPSRYFMVYDSSLNTLNLSGKAKSIDNVIDILDWNNIKLAHRHLLMILSSLEQERDSFVNREIWGKIRFLSLQIKLILEELPIVSLRLEEFTNMLDERLHFGTFKFCFLVGVTFIEGLVSKCQSQKEQFQRLAEILCPLIQSEAFNEALADLGLLEAPQQAAAAAQATTGSRTPDNDDPIKRLNFDRLLWSPPRSDQNPLALKMAEYCQSDKHADMILVVHDTDVDGQKVEIPCHRFILASRCPYFKRALLSGMREAIERRIEVHDVNSTIFNHFLRFVYGGSVEANDFSIDTLSELLLLADRYEMDSLKDVCELELCTRIDMESALSLFSIGDQFNAAILKAKSSDFIQDNEELLYSTTFGELRDDLQAELQSKLGLAECSRNRRSSEKSVDSVSKLINLTGSIRLMGDDVDSMAVGHDGGQLEQCVSQLREVLGPLIDEDQLVRVSLAADFDLNRAVNYFLNSEQN